MANPIQQGLKHRQGGSTGMADRAAMANPIQQGLKPYRFQVAFDQPVEPQWLIQYNKD